MPSLNFLLPKLQFLSPSDFPVEVFHFMETQCIFFHIMESPCLFLKVLKRQDRSCEMNAVSSIVTEIL